MISGRFRVVGRWLVAAALVVSGLRGNISFVQRDGQTLVPVGTAAVRMAAEEVVIRPGGNGWEVEAWFEMVNDTDAEVAGLIGFPLSGLRADFRRQLEVDQAFRVETSTEAGDAGFASVSVTLEVGDEAAARPIADAIPRRGEYLENLVWEARWEPGQTRWFKVRYEMGVPTYPPGAIGLVEAERLTYVVRTANLWNGPVGRATFRVRTSDGPYLRPDDRVKLASVRSSFAPLPEIGEPLTWTFEQWSPTVDWNIDLARWQGLPEGGEEYDFCVWLPDAYRGDQELYNDGLLDRLVERELGPARTYFPARVAKVDRARLRQIVAMWLHQEIFARRGEPFIVAPYVSDAEDEVHPASDVRDENFYYSGWNEAFRPYAHQKGFYEPNHDLGAKGVPWRKLNRWEKANVRFLRSVFAPGTEDARTGALK